MKAQYQLTQPIYYFSKVSKRWCEISYHHIYEHKRVNNCRRVKTMHERRWNEAHAEFVRGKRRSLPTVNDDIRPSFSCGSCWKRFTKNKHQWQH